MSLVSLRVRAVLWGTIGFVALVAPWSRQHCDPGYPPAVAVTAVIAVLAAVMLVTVLRRAHGWVPRHTLRDIAGYRALLAVAACGEEVLFRGIVLGLVGSWRGALVGVLVSSLVFGLAHWPRRRSRDAVIHMMTGVVFGTIAWLSGGWLASAIVHVTYNCVAFAWVPGPVEDIAPGRRDGACAVGRVVGAGAMPVHRRPGRASAPTQVLGSGE